MAATGNASFGAVTFKVTPEVLEQKANTVSSKITSMLREFQNMKNTVTKSSSYWIGDAGDLHRKVYGEKEPDIEEIFLRLKEYVTDLQQIARQYTQTENEVKDVVQALQDDVIS
ncbi:MAG: WXG100 family type VII secretion target [Lachnospiraceae bacterium]|nr:WXG100 family type VII secretion target [Lachnospiraceae bacterium]